METARFELGKKYRDKVTGFKGIAVGYFKWLTGCATVQLQPPVDKDGKVPETGNFDEIRLEEVKDDPVKVETKTNPGGPQDTPQAPNET